MVGGENNLGGLNESDFSKMIGYFEGLDVELPSSPLIMAQCLRPLRGGHE